MVNIVYQKDLFCTRKLCRHKNSPKWLVRSSSTISRSQLFDPRKPFNKTNAIVLIFCTQSFRVSPEALHLITVFAISSAPKPQPSCIEQ
ncbi:hypothetical protein EVAR_68447_1 [Eumeta japonica]|uniref:Uncharacterized protein n=1 Tax=Eumeta variegata TaxID=151549 RepID=A0A4C1SSD7_EUMVA|nr:hypothetical protein EVAR_68447_1 [Eumeta japonica]